MSIRLSARRARNLLLGVAAALTLLSVAAQAYIFLISDRALDPADLVYALDARQETTIITWYSSAMLLGCSVLAALTAAIIRSQRRPYLVHWAVFSVALLLAAMDETAALHERLSAFLRGDLLDTTGILGGIFLAAWVLPAILLLIVYGTAFAPLLRDLPSRSRRLIVGALLVFLFGAVGTEMIEGLLIDEFDVNRETFGWAVFLTSQDAIEMAGVALLAYGLLVYASSLTREVQLKFD